MSVPVVDLDGVAHEVGRARLNLNMLPVYTLCGYEGWTWTYNGALRFDAIPTCLWCVLREQPTEVLDAALR